MVLLILLVLGMVSNCGKEKSSSVSTAPAKPVEVVSNSAWDGSVRQVERWLKNNLKDPDSFQAIEWSPVVKTGDGFMVRCKYRAKNSFGGYVVEEKMFRLDSQGNVLSALSLNGN